MIIFKCMALTHIVLTNNQTQKYHETFDMLSHAKYLSKLSKAQLKTIEDKKPFFFSGLPPSLVGEIRMDSEAAYSVTSMPLAEETTSVLLQATGLRNSARDLCITDCTACVGGNTINFTKHFGTVHSIELDPLKCEFLQHNVNLVCGGDAYRVTVHNKDALSLVSTLTQDILFLDPPWGGHGYSEHASVDLFLSGKSLSEVCESFKGMARFIAIKVPFNFNRQGFLQGCSTVWSELHTARIGQSGGRGGRHSRAKFHLLILKETV